MSEPGSAHIIPFPARPEPKLEPHHGELNLLHAEVHVVSASELTRVRTAAGLSVENAAAAAQVDIEELIQFETGGATPTLTQVYALADVYGTSGQALLLAVIEQVRAVRAGRRPHPLTLEGFLSPPTPTE